MRWKHSKNIGPNLLDERFIQTFLLSPRRIEDETRWLERSKILQRYVSYTKVHVSKAGPNCCWEETAYKWIDVCFWDEINP